MDTVSLLCIFCIFFVLVHMQQERKNRNSSFFQMTYFKMLNSGLLDMLKQNFSEDEYHQNEMVQGFHNDKTVT